MTANSGMLEIIPRHFLCSWHHSLYLENKPMEWWFPKFLVLTASLRNIMIICVPNHPSIQVLKIKQTNHLTKDELHRPHIC